MAWNEPGPSGQDPWGTPRRPRPGQGNNGGNGNGSNNRPDGPPDLEKILSDMKKRVFGNTGGGNGPRPAGGNGGPVGLGRWPLVLAAVVVVLWVLSGTFVVDAQEKAVVTRFGKPVYIADPGLHWRLPWPFEDARKVVVTQVQSFSDAATMLTEDENLVQVQLTVQFRVSNPVLFLYQINDPENAVITEATRASVREVVGSSPMDYILTDGRDEIGERTKRLLQARLDEYKAGLSVMEVNLQQVQPPSAVQDAFADAIKAREDQQRLKNEAEAYANDRIPKARGAAARMLQEGAAYRDQLIAKAEGESDRFDKLATQAARAPGVTRERLYFETMTDVYSRTPKVVLDAPKGAPALYLPLDSLFRKRGGEPDAAGPATSGMGPRLDTAPLPSASASSSAVAPGASPAPPASAAAAPDNGDDAARSRSRSRL